MTAVAGSLLEVHTIKSDAVSAIQVAEVVFTVSGTYASADDGVLTTVPTHIQNSRRNGKTVTMRGVMTGQNASKASDPTNFLSLASVAISSTSVTFVVNDNDYSTEIADGAFPAQERPFSILVAFTEA